MNAVKIINDVRKTQQDLNEIYVATMEGYSSLKPLKLSKKMLNLLLSNSMLISTPNGKYDTKYMWNGVKPDFVFSYNFHNKLKGKDETFSDVKKKLETPENLNPKEIIEVLAVVSQTEKKETYLKETKTSLLNKNRGVVEVHTEQVNEKITPPENDLLGQQNDIKFLIEAFTDPNKSVLLGLLIDIIGLLKENTNEIESIRNTQKLLVAIGKSNQANIFDIISSEYNIIREQFFTLKNLTDNKENIQNFEERLQCLEKSMQFLKKRTSSNETTKLKYG